MDQLGTQTFDQRFQSMVRYGQQAQKDAELNKWLSQLAEGNFYHRLLALQACYGSHNQDLVIRFLTDPSQIIRQQAIKLAPLVCDDQSIIDMISQLAIPEQKTLLTKLVKKNRQTVIDQYIRQIANKRKQLAAFLPYASVSTIHLYKKFILEEAKPALWGKLATYYPALISEWLAEKWQQTKANMAECEQILQVVLTTLTKKGYGLKLIDLLKELPENIEINKLHLETVIRKHPEEMAAVLLQKPNTQECFRQFVDVVDQLKPETMQKVYHRALSTSIFHPHWLKKLPKAQVENLYHQYLKVWREQKNYLDTSLIAELPTELRVKEAKRNLALPVFAAHPENRLPYAQFLPWSEAYEMVAPFLRNADAAIRQTAICTLIKTIRYQRTAAATLLQVLKKRKHEQDPVRLSIFHELSQLPPSIWQKEHVLDLSMIIQDALDSTDLSGSTASYMERLVLRIIPFHTEWSVDQLVTLIESKQKIYHHHFAEQLTNDQAKQLLTKLMPVCQRLFKLGKDNDIANLLSSFGQRLRVCDQWTTFVEPSILQTHKRWVLEKLLYITRTYQFPTFVQLVPKLLEKDATFAYVHQIADYLHHRRQDLLTPYLKGTLYKGRFHSGPMPYTFNFTTGFYRWTISQQQLFGNHLLSTIKQLGSKRDYDLKMRLKQFALLPAIDHQPLFDFIKHPQQTIRTHAVQILGTLDQGEGLPILINTLAGPDARTAIYALRQQLPYLPPQKMLDILKKVPFDRVTIAKETVRLIGELTSEEAYQYLLSLAKQALHPDVIAALVHAFANHYDRQESWEILQTFSKSEHESVLLAIVQLPIDRLMPASYMPKYLSLCQSLLQHEQVHIRLRLLYRLRQLSDPDQILTSALFMGLQKREIDEVEARAAAIIDLYQAQDQALVKNMFEQVKSNLYHLSKIMKNVRTNALWSTNKYQETITTLVAVLSHIPPALSQRLQLAFAHLSVADTVKLINEITANDGLHAEAMMNAVQAIDRSAEQKESTHLEQLEAAFARNPNASVRRLALAALIAHADIYGWTTKNEQKLAQYQQDKSPLVASAALFTFPHEAGDGEFDEYDVFDDDELS